MNRESLKPLEPELADLIQEERAEVVPSLALARIGKRLSASTGSEGGGRGGGPTPARARGRPSPLAAAMVAGAFVAGGATGVWIDNALRPPPPVRIVYVDRAPPPQAPPPASGAVEERRVATSGGSVQGTGTKPRSSPSPAARPRAATANATPPAEATKAGPTSTLEQERRILDEARKALVAGDGVRALGLIEVHAQRFPQPELGEEREALAVQALVALGRYDEARARAARLRAASPASLFLPAVDAALEAIP